MYYIRKTRLACVFPQPALMIVENDSTAQFCIIYFLSQENTIKDRRTLIFYNIQEIIKRASVAFFRLREAQTHTHT